MRNFIEIIEKKLNLKTHDFETSSENINYSGSTYRVKEKKVISRLVKLTPKKKGYFVALWKRNNEGICIPYNVEDGFDLYVFNVSDEEKMGQFIFSVKVLESKKIVSSKSSKGKNGFRLYPPWETNLNKTALNAQKWQSNFFIDFTDKYLDKDYVESLYQI